MLQLFRNVGLGADIFESLMWFQLKELSKFIQGTQIPGSRLLHAENCDGFETFRYVVWSKCT